MTKKEFKKELSKKVNVFLNESNLICTETSLFFNTYSDFDEELEEFSILSNKIRNLIKELKNKVETD